MDTLTILAWLALLGIGAMLYLQFQPRVSKIALETEAKLQAELDQSLREIGVLSAQLDQLKTEKSDLAAKGKESFLRGQELAIRLEEAQRRTKELERTLATLEEQQERKQKELNDNVSRLNQAEKSLQQERNRLEKADETRREHELKERDRIWAEHEMNTKAMIMDIAKRPEYGFSIFENTNLPEGFDGSLKPDCLVEFLGQYVVFDAKTSRSDNLQQYLNDQVKKTAEKLQDAPIVYKTVFFVVPSPSVAELKRTNYLEGGFTFFVITPECIEPILAAFKKITAYEFAEQMNPQERENIVDLLAQLDYHINLRNAADLMLTQHGINVLQKKTQLPPDMTAAVSHKAQKMKTKAKLSESDLKRIVQNTLLQQTEVQQLCSPQAAVQTDLLSGMPA